MKIKSVCLGILTLIFSLVCARAQMDTWYTFIAPVHPATELLNRTEMRKAIPYLMNGQLPPTNNVPLAAQLSPLGEDDITPGDAMSSKRFPLWRGAEVLKNNKQYRKQMGNAPSAILILEGDGYYPLPLRTLRVTAQIFNPTSNEFVVIKPSRIYLEVFTYKRNVRLNSLNPEWRNVEWELKVNSNGEPLKPIKRVFTRMDEIRKSAVVVDSMNLVVQFSGVSVNADSFPGATNQEKISQAYKTGLELGKVIIDVTFVEAEGTDDEVVEFNTATHVWVSDLPK